MKPTKINDYLNMDISLLYKKITGKENESGSEMAGREYLYSIDKYLFQKICIEMEFCKNKSSFNYLDKESLARVLDENLVDFKEISDLQRMILVAILLKIGLSRFCKC